jgi:hypothetical protein
MSTISIIPARNYCSIDGEARRVDCSALTGITRLTFDDVLNAGATWPICDPLDLDDAPVPITALPAAAADIVDAWGNTSAPY